MDGITTKGYWMNGPKRKLSSSPVSSMMRRSIRLWGGFQLHAENPLRNCRCDPFTYHGESVPEPETIKCWCRWKNIRPLHEELTASGSVAAHRAGLSTRHCRSTVWSHWRQSKHTFNTLKVDGQDLRDTLHLIWWLGAKCYKWCFIRWIW